MAARPFFAAVVALGLLAVHASASAVPLVGRVFDAMEATVFVAASVSLPRFSVTAQTDRHGFFRLTDVPPGVHTVDIALADGRSFTARVTVRKGRPLAFAELDYSRIVPPDEDDEY